MMLRLSRERVNQLARELLDALTRAQAVSLLKDREVVRQSIAHALADELKREEEREEKVRKRIAAIRPAPSPADYDELFRTFLEEEHLRDGLE